MAKGSVLYGVVYSGGEVTTEQVMEEFDLTRDDLLGDVFRIDPVPPMYAVVLAPGCTKELESREGWEVSGPWDNPRVGPA